jgi:FkbM family methyltransferase
VDADAAVQGAGDAVPRVAEGAESALSRAETTNVLNRVLHHPHVQPHVSAAMRGRLVRESARFTLRQLHSTGSAHVYRVRESGLRVLLAHGTPDVLTLDQAFSQHVYEPPEAVRAALRALGRPLRAIDLGANIGLWGLWLHGRFAVAHVTALEPDPENVAKHRRQIALNDLDGSWELVQAAATCADGPVPFTVGRTTTGRIGGDGDAGTAAVAGLDVFALLGDVDLLKVDIEGAEWPILSDPRLAGMRVPVVMFEYHPHDAPSANPGEDARLALEAVGYKTQPVHGAADGTGIVWGWRA